MEGDRRRWAMDDDTTIMDDSGGRRTTTTTAAGGAEAKATERAKRKRKRKEGGGRLLLLLLLFGCFVFVLFAARAMMGDARWSDVVSGVRISNFKNEQPSKKFKIQVLA